MALPALALAGLKWLPAIGAVGGAIPGLRKGNVGEALLGAGTGALTGWGVGGPIKGLTAAGTRMAGGLAPSLVRGVTSAAAPFGLKSLPLNALGATGIGLQNAAALGIPLAGAAGTFGLAGGFSGMANQGVNKGLQTGAGLVGYNAVQPNYGAVPPGSFGPAVPPGLGQFGGTNLYGSNPYDVIDPSGAFSANRLMQLKQNELNAKMLDNIAAAQMKWTEETKRRDLQRQLAAAGIRSNIATQAGMLRDANMAGLTQGTNAMQQVGSALTNNYSYS